MLKFFRTEWENHRRAQQARNAKYAKLTWFGRLLYQGSVVGLVGLGIFILWLLTACAPTAQPPVSTETPGPSAVEDMQRQIESSLAQAEAGNFERTIYCVNAITPVYLYPTEAAPLVTHLKFGQIVSLTFYVTDGWLKVDYDGGSGYVARKSVTECAP